MPAARTLARVVLRVAVSPVVGVLWLLRRRVRVELVLPNVTLFGHLALEPEKHLAARRRTDGVRTSDARRPRVWDLWSFGRPRARANPALTRMWMRRVTAVPSPVADAMHRVASAIPGFAIPVADFDKLHENDDVLDDGPSFLRPTPEEEHRLERYLASHGLDRGAPFVCMVVRDARFAPVGSGPHASGPLRSRSFEDFLPAALALTARGIAVVKVGSAGTFEVSGRHPLLVDYANDEAKDPVLDVMLPARATAVISTMSGPDAVALAAHRPVLYLDLVQYSLCFAGTRLTTWVPALLRDASGRICSMREAFDRGAGRALGVGGLEAAGVAPILSTPDVIGEYVVGYVDRVLHPVEPDPAIDRLQERYRVLYRELLMRASVRPLGPLGSRLADEFLRRHGEAFLA